MRVRALLGKGGKDRAPVRPVHGTERSIRYWVNNFKNQFFFKRKRQNRHSPAEEAGYAGFFCVKKAGRDIIRGGERSRTDAARRLGSALLEVGREKGHAGGQGSGRACPSRSLSGRDGGG